MSEEPAASPPASIANQLLTLLRRPIEYGLTGAALVGVLFLANRSEILPKVFKGAGFEVEFQERVIQTTADTEQGIKVLRANVQELKADLNALRLALENDEAPVLAEAMVTVESSASEFKKDADGASKDSLLVKQDQLIQTKGFMWLGTYDPRLEAWTDVSVRSLDGTPLAAPAKLSNEVLELTTTVNVRDGYPPNDDAYFRAVRALGIAETGSRATLLAVPQPYDREGVQQIWGQVDVKLRPYIGINTAD